MYNDEKIHIIDEAENFKFRFSIKENHFNIDIDSYKNSKGYFSENFIKLLKIYKSNEYFIIDSLPFSISILYEDFFKILLGSEEYLNIIISNNIVNLEVKFRKLIIFETRIIARYPGNYIPQKISISNFLTTDLHTHLSGQIDSQSLIKMGLDYDVLYPTRYLDLLKVKYDNNNIVLIQRRSFLPLAHLNEDSNTESAINLKYLKDSQLKILEHSLSLSPESQSTFEDIENCYQYREPFTKNIKLLEEIFCSIAKDYNINKVRYAELSSNSIIEEEWLNIINKLLPSIEQKYSVKFRFLIGLPRNLSKENFVKRIESIKKIYNNKYIIGIDLLGYEISKTTDHEEQLKTLANHIKYKRPEFIFRIHAGENSKNPENVKEALFFALENKVRIRIGHSIYGIDNETIKLAQILSKENLLTVEFNPDSNLASNNIDFPEDVPIKKFIDSSIKSVISSDGAGIYKTSAKQLYILGKICGLTDKDFEFINRTENEYIESAINPKKVDFAEIHDKDYNKEDLEKKIPILIAGAKGSSWLEIDLIDREKIKDLFKDLMYNLDPNKYFFITGRSKDKGIAIELGKEILLYNFNHNKKYIFISSVLEREDSDFKKAKGISYIEDSSAPLVYLPSTMISYIKKNKGIAIFIGGKSFTRDFIVEAEKQKVDFALMAGIKGASNDKAKIYTKNSFTNFEQLQKILF